MKNSYTVVLLIVLLTNVFAINSRDLIINEVLSSNITGECDSTGYKNDWIEIYNATNSSINLHAYSLSDDANQIDKWSFPNVTIAPKAYIIVYASEESHINTQLHCNFKLSKEGEILTLSSPDGSLIDKLQVPALEDDISYGKVANGAGAYKYYASPTPGKANTSHPYNGYLKELAKFTKAAGFYTEEVSIGAEYPDHTVTLRYTTDGSEPNKHSPILHNDIRINNTSENENYFSMIKTNPSFEYPKPGFDKKRADSRGWLPPYTKVAKGTIFKVKAFKNEYIPSRSATNTYFIFSEGADRYSCPVISITTEEANFFDEESGIYVYGTTGLEGNYKESGREWERPVNVQYFENDGTMAFQQAMGARIHGGGGRHSTVKNIRLYARDEYGKSELKYNFFQDEENKTFKRILVRGPGHRPDCAPRDDLADLLLQNQDMDIQHMQHVIVFLNGEYWGIHTIKERFDLDYLSIKYGKKDDNFVIMKNGGSLDKGEIGDDQHYFDLLDYIENNDMSLPEHFEYLKTQIDLDNYLSFLAAEIYMGNVDWVITNIKFWRYKGDKVNTTSLNPFDGRWRWFMFDFDLVFGGSCDNINPNVHIMDDVFDPELGKATILPRGLKQNSDFERLFVNRLCDQMNSMFTTQNFRKRLAEIDSMMSPEMLEHTQRWRYPSVASTLVERKEEIPSLAQWRFIFKSLYQYPIDRKRKIIDHLDRAFSLSDTANIEVDINNKEMGYVKVNSLVIDEHLDGVSPDVYPWNGMYFQDLPITVEAKPKLGYRFVKWANINVTSPTLTISLEQDTSLQAIFAIDPDYNTSLPLYINEIMASNNDCIDDAYHTHPDWIELFNPNGRAINLSHYFISDDLENPYKYQFPRENLEIPAYGYQIVWCDGYSNRGPWYTSFKLSSEGESVILSAPDSTMVDMVEFGEQGEDVSYGRHNDGNNQWVYFAPPLHATPAYSNSEAANIHDLAIGAPLLHPNPVNKGESVSLIEVTDYKLYNSLGVVVQEEFNAKVIKTNKLKQGLYFVKTPKYKSKRLIVK